VLYSVGKVAYVWVWQHPDAQCTPGWEKGAG
jgi:hypothetical protein